MRSRTVRTMDNLQVNSKQVNGEVVELLSHLTRKNLTQGDITPPVVFWAALIMMSMGVMFADGIVEESERLLLDKTLEALVTPDRNVGQLMRRLVSGLEENPVYQNPQQWLQLTDSLNRSERTLLLSLGYDMAGVDGELHPLEEEYLRLTADSLGVDPRLTAVMSARVRGQEIPDRAAVDELESLLKPEEFTYLELRLVSLDAVELLSRLTGQRQCLVTVTPVFLFLAALVTISLGVMAADGIVQESEKDLLDKTLTRLVPPTGDLRQLLLRLIDIARDREIYDQQSEWLKLVSPLSEAEKVLLLSFAYEMSAADGTIDPKESEYLQQVANSLGIDSRYAAVLESGFAAEEGISDEEAWQELLSLLNPDRFLYLDRMFVDAAGYIIDQLEVLSL